MTEERKLAVVAFGGNALLRSEDHGTQEEQIAYAKSLRLAKNGWTPESHERRGGPSWTAAEQHQLYGQQRSR